MLDVAGRLVSHVGLLNSEVRINTKKFMDEISKFEETGCIVFPLLNCFYFLTYGQIFC